MVLERHNLSSLYLLYLSAVGVGFSHRSEGRTAQMRFSGIRRFCMVRSIFVLDGLPSLIIDPWI